MAINNISFNPNINQKDQFQLGKLGAITTFQPRVAPASTGSEYGISIPHNYSYTMGEDGNTQIAMGQDGLNARHISQSELDYMQKEKGLARNLLALA